MNGCGNPNDPAQSNDLRGLSLLQLLKVLAVFPVGSFFKFDILKSHF